MNSIENPYEVIVVGSGLCGAMAAETLVNKGRNVVMLDVAYKDETKIKYPDTDYISIRKNSDEQRKLFLGENFEGIGWGATKTGAQLTPGRKYLINGIEKWLPVVSENFFPMETLGYGGLGSAWGAGCYVFSDAEFQKMGFRKSDFDSSYQIVADRIGISAGNDDATRYTVENLKNILPPVQPEANIGSIFRKYQHNKKRFNAKGFYAGLPSVAIRTEDKDDRKKLSYSDMEFWNDNEKSVYRAWMTVDELKRRNNFQIIEKQLVLSFHEENGIVAVRCRNVESNEEQIYYSRKLVLCSGVLGTARIVLRSFDGNKKLPLSCNPYIYMPMINWSRLGSVPEQRKNSMVQFISFYDKHGDNSDVPMAALFTYRSLMLNRLIKEVPLGFGAGREAIQYLSAAMVIAGIHHPEFSGSEKYLQLQKHDESITGDKLFVNYTFADEELDVAKKNEWEFIKFFLQLGCAPVKKVHPGYGSSIHYGGTLPLSDKEEQYTTAYDGRLHGTSAVFIADGSAFKFLPAKGVSFSLMANAERVASKL